MPLHFKIYNMKVKMLCILICCIFCTALQAQKLQNSIDSVSYALGILFGKNIQSGGFQDINADIFGQTARKVIRNEALEMTSDQANLIVNDQYRRIQSAKYEKNLNDGRLFLNNNKNASGVVSLPSGVQYKVITQGNGAKPSATDKVTVHYHGTLIDGTIFDSSVERNQPVELSLNQVIRGWTEAMQLMPVGSKWILYIPSELAYGENPRPGGIIEPYSALIFEVELISINN